MCDSHTFALVSSNDAVACAFRRAMVYRAPISLLENGKVLPNIAMTGPSETAKNVAQLMVATANYALVVFILSHTTLKCTCKVCILDSGSVPSLS